MSETEELKTTFTDTSGRVWNLRLTIAKAMLLRDKLGFDIEKVIDTQAGPMASLLDDSWKLVEILLALTAQERKEQNVSDDDFLNALEGETLDEATRAFLNGVTLSLKKLKRRTMAAIVRQMEIGTETAAKKLEKKVQEAGQKMAEKLDSVIGG